jgi:hypothetical protein
MRRTELEIKNPDASSGLLHVAVAGPVTDRRAARDGYQLHAASGGELTQTRATRPFTGDASCRYGVFAAPAAAPAPIPSTGAAGAST